MSHSTGLIDKSKELQKEILMEKLRSKTSQHKNLTETSKAVRMNMLDKRWAVDSVDRMILQKCLDSLQHCIKIGSLQSLIERLDCLSRQLGLKFVVGSTGVNLFISSDMFYVEIMVDPSGAVKDVKIHHEGKIEQQSCEELVSCISKGDFADFTAQLEGLTSVYQLSAEKKVKSKAFSALQSLEEDLCTLKQLQSYLKEPWAHVHKGPIGFLQKRRGGHAMRLTYFISPYELLDKEKGLQPLTIELLTTGKPALTTGLASLVAPSHTPLGLSALVLLEGSSPNKLQLAPIISSGQRAGKGSNGPVYAPLVPQNSAMLPACFTLKLSQPMPLCTGLAKLIQATTDVEIAGDWSNAKPILGLICQQAYNKIAPTGKTMDLNLNKGLIVNLPDQTQCFYMSESRGLEGVVVSSVPFTHPSHVPTLLACLRQQALFNTLIESCVRVQVKQANLDPSTIIMSEVSAVSWSHVSVSLAHPPDESVCSLELDLSDPSSPRPRLCTLSDTPSDSPPDDYLARVLATTRSIPLTLRALIKVWESEAAKPLNGGYALDGANFRSGPTPHDSGGESRDATRYNNNQHNQHHGGGYLTESKHHMSMMCQDSPMDAKPQIADERKKKRKSDGDPWATHKKGKPGMSELMDSDSESENSNEYANEDDNTMNSNSTNDDIEGRESSVSQNDFASDMELSAMDAVDDAVVNDNTMSDGDNSRDADVGDVIRNPFQKSEHKRQKLKSRDADLKSAKSTSSLLLDLTDGKPFMPSSVSITPITPNSVNNPISSILMDRRPGIEIIPITTAPPAALPSSITITPITTSQAKTMDDRIRSEKKKSGEERSKEKKKKRRRDDPMGPPEKVPPKQDPLTKPVSVSIKPTDGSPMRSSSPNSMMRKFSPSPTHGRSVSITKSSSPNALKSGKSGSSSHHSSPRHSPVQNSPKHLSGYSSPKSQSVSSPKHSSSSSGKPSMSALKSAAGAPASKTAGYDLSKKAPKDGYSGSSSSRDKEKKHSGLSFSSSSGRSSPKLKSIPKMKQLEIIPAADAPAPEPLTSPSHPEANKSSAPSQIRNRKFSLSAVIDKLKSAQHVADDPPAKGAPSAQKFDSKNSSPVGGGGGKTDTKTQEYMVKPSSDGMKITINKTRTKESSGGSSSKLYGGSSGSKQSSPQLTPPSQGSPKTHTGLKPGVLSGPASKKTQVLQSSKAPPSAAPPKAALSPSDALGGTPAPKPPYSKSSSSATGMNLSKSVKTSSGSPKSGDISKIIRDRDREKARAKSGNSSDKSIFSKSERHSSPGGSRDEPDDRFKPKEANFLVEGLIKPLDTSKFQIPKLKNQSEKNDSVPGKYPFAYHSPNARGEESGQKAAYPLSVPRPPSPTAREPGEPSTQSAAPATPQEAEMLLDFSSSSKVSGVVAVRPVVAASPLLRSPHSASSAITDDELLDEALVGPGN